MFNLKKAKKSSNKVAPGNKALEKRRTELDNVAKDKTSSHEKLLEEQRKGAIDKTTEGQMDKRSSEKEQIWEKKVERKKIAELYMPSINAFVEEKVQERREEFTSAQKKESNWTTEASDQNGALPAWPKISGQHDKKVLPNDVDRKKNEPLIGGKITKASLDNVVFAVKNGYTQSSDEKMVSILKKASEEKRDLTLAEKQEITKIKTKRNKAFI